MREGRRRGCTFIGGGAQEWPAVNFKTNCHVIIFAFVYTLCMHVIVLYSFSCFLLSLFIYIDQRFTEIHICTNLFVYNSALKISIPKDEKT